MRQMKLTRVANLRPGVAQPQILVDDALYLKGGATPFQQHKGSQLGCAGLLGVAALQE